MNAPTQAAHLAPAVQARPVPQAFIDALKARFGDNCSTALVIREQHRAEAQLGCLSLERALRHHVDRARQRIGRR